MYIPFPYISFPFIHWLREAERETKKVVKSYEIEKYN